jgi:hypothetical protein
MTLSPGLFHCKKANVYSYFRKGHGKGHPVPKGMDKAWLRPKHIKKHQNQLSNTFVSFPVNPDIR